MGHCPCHTNWDCGLREPVVSSGLARVGSDLMVPPNRLRGAWRTDTGQLVEQWVPGGLYLIEPHDNPAVVTLRDDRGRTFDTAKANIPADEAR